MSALLHIVYVTFMVIFLFGITIFVHEFAHFIVARRLKMIVEVFSIGFGPAIWKRKYKGVLYKVGCIPIGGYVALPQMEPGGAAAGNGTASVPPPVSPFAKIAVAFAGGVGNILLALVIAWVIYCVGKPSTPAERCAIIGFVETNSVAYTCGLRTGDEIIAINGSAVVNWNDVLQRSVGFKEVELDLETPAGPRTITIPTVRSVMGFRMIGGIRAITICKIEVVDPGSTAARAGLQSGDIIKSFDGTDVLGVEHLISLIGPCRDVTRTITVERGGILIKSELTPFFDEKLGRARIGIRFDLMAVDYDKTVKIPPGVQLRRHATAILRVVRALLTPGQAGATSQGLAGPPMIIFFFIEMVRKSFIMALWFTCFLNVNLAIINLLPIPVLDGGHILFSLWEAVTRRPVHPKIVIWSTQIFAVLLIMLFLFLSQRDAVRIFRIWRISQPAPAQQQPDKVPAHSAEQPAPAE